MAWIWLTITLICLGLFLHSWLFRSHNRAKKLPPGPKGFPFLGSLHLLREFPHRDLCRLARRYGPIMHMRLGVVPAIVISSPQAAELFLKTYDHVFASRPITEASKVLSYGQKNLGFAPYGSHWRNMRKICTSELLSNRKVDSFKSMRKEELGLLIDHLREAAKDQVSVNLSYKVASLATDMTTLMVFGRKYEDSEFDERGFKALIREVLQLGAAPNLGDFIPYIAALDLQGISRHVKSINKVFDGFFERIIDEHLKSMGEEKTKDFVDVMLELMASEEIEYRIDRTNIKAMMFDMLIAATDTSATAIVWAISEIIKHPQITRKMQDELEKVVALDQMVEESYLENLEYLNMVVKETLRLHPPAPLMVSHESLEDCTINGFHIPKKSCIIVNAWAIGQDTTAWMDPEKFFPERFIDSQVDVKGRDFQLIPFGSGRRSCPGMQLGLILTRLVLAQLVHCFDWELPNYTLPTELDMTEKFGLTCVRDQDLMVIPIYRLHK